VIEIFDNIFTKEEIAGLDAFVNSSTFPYFLKIEKYDQGNISSRLLGKDLSKFSTFNYMCHQIIFDSELTSPNAKPASDMILDIICSRIDFKYSDVIASRVNLLLPGNTCTTGLPHVDWQIPHKVVLYYVNNSDGNTVLYNDDLNVLHEIEPIAGRFIIFDGNYLHSNYAPKNTHRIVFNLNVI
jgi:hypothetical protein